MGIENSNQDYPYNIYRIDPAHIDEPVIAGQLAFKSRAIAQHPQTGQLYYASYYTVIDGNGWNYWYQG